MRPASDFSVYRAAEEAPTEAAVVHEDGVVTYRALAERVADAQIRVRDSGAKAGERWAMEARPDLASLVAVSALLEEGVVPCLLHPRLPKSMKRQLAERVSATWGPPPEAVDLGGSAAEPRPGPALHPEADAAVFFTSGSSGLPKGVRLSWRAFFASAAASARNLGWQANDRWLLNLPLAHIGGFSILVRTRLARRAVVLPLSGSARPFVAKDFVETLVRNEVTLASLVPTMFDRVIEARLDPPSPLRALLLGGASAPARLLRAAALRSWPVLTTYGLTEACSQVTVQRYGMAPGEAQGAGFPLEGTEIRIGDGRIQVRGPTLFSGYLPAENPSGESSGCAVRQASEWFETGDLGRLDLEGRLFVEGRADDLIISGGENVSPARVEASLRELPGVAEAVVYGLPDPRWGEIVAASVRPSDPDLTEETLVSALRTRVAGFEQVRRLRFVRELPLLPNGKIDRRTVRRDAQRSGSAEVSDGLD